jgi:hypothetical protein
MALPQLWLIQQGACFSNASKLIGIEINEYFCALQKQMVREFEFEDKISIVHRDVKECKDILRSSDVILFHNVFEYFSAEQEEMWRAILDMNLTRGTLIFSCPSLVSLFERSQVSFDSLE